MSIPGVYIAFLFPIRELLMTQCAAFSISLISMAIDRSKLQQLELEFQSKVQFQF